MKYQQFCLLSLSFLLVLTGVAAAQQPGKLKRPVKNPPQYPNIIDLDNKDNSQRPQQSQPADAPDQPAVTAQPQDTLTQALTALTSEVRTLVQELRSMNLRQQAQLDTLRMTRVDMRIDHYERELRPVRERISALEVDEQNLYQLMTPQSLLAQTANMATLNRDQTMQQIKSNYEAKLRFVQNEKERLRKVESDLISSLGIYQNLGSETEKRMRATEDLLRQIEGVKEINKTEPKQ
jgi:hypothetical protein